MPQIELNSVCNQSLYKQLSQNVDSDDEDSEDEVIRFKSKPRSGPQGVAMASMSSPTAPKLENHPILIAPRTEQIYLNHAAAERGVGVTAVGQSILVGTQVAILNEGGINSTNQDDDSADGQIIMERRPMSLCRKICFCLSIFFCFASVVIFLWGLPCNNELTCPVRSGIYQETLSSPATNWIRDFEKVEFKSVISVSTNGVNGHGKNVIFMYRGDRIFEKPTELPSHHNGILAVMGLGGQISWYDQMADEPTSIDCGILDVDLNGITDCLVISYENGQLGCINPVSGQWMWHISLYQTAKNASSENRVARKAIDLLDFPLILPDIDGDLVNDLLMVTSLEQVHHNNFLFVSGAHGRPIGKAYTLTNCEFIHKLQLEAGTFKLFFNCLNNDTELTRSLSMFELFKLATGEELSRNQLPTVPVDQHKFYGQRKNTQNQRNIYSNGQAAELIVENSGKCPNCTMTMSVGGVGNGDPVTIIQGNMMYGMVPAVLNPKSRRMHSKDLHTGFVIKFWEWIVDETTKKEDEDEKHQSSTELPKTEKKQEEMPTKDLVMRRLKEHVVLIMFNGTTHRVINTSQSDIIQFCREEPPGMNSFCQPDMIYQQNSVTIANLDDDVDGDQELVTFYSTFVKKKEIWKLVTYVQSFCLEKELASLYDT